MPPSSIVLIEPDRPSQDALREGLDPPVYTEATVVTERAAPVDVEKTNLAYGWCQYMQICLIIVGTLHCLLTWFEPRERIWHVPPFRDPHLPDKFGHWAIVVDIEAFLVRALPELLFSFPILRLLFHLVPLLQNDAIIPIIFSIYSSLFLIGPLTLLNFSTLSLVYTQSVAGFYSCHPLHMYLLSIIFLIYSYIVARFLRSIPHSDTPQVDLTYKSLLWIVIVVCAPFFPFLPMLILKTFSVPEMFALQGWLVSLLALQAIIIHRTIRFARFQRQNIIHGNFLW